MAPRGPIGVAALWLLCAACVIPDEPPPERPRAAAPPERLRPAAPPPAQPTVEVGSDAGGSIVRERLRAVKDCYEEQLKKTDPTLSGTLVLHWTIEPNGTVGNAHVEKDTVGNPALTDCILHHLRGWRFPAPANGDSVDVSFPFYFRSTP